MTDLLLDLPPLDELPALDNLPALDDLPALDLSPSIGGDQTEGYAAAIRAQGGYLDLVIWPDAAEMFPPFVPRDASVIAQVGVDRVGVHAAHPPLIGAGVSWAGSPAGREHLIEVVVSSPKKRGRGRPKKDKVPQDPNAPAAYSESASDNIHVNTPERELDLVRSFADIGLDPCSNPTSTVGARVDWWGPKPVCAICRVPATHGTSNSNADRCALHTHDNIRDKESPRTVRVPDEILADARYGIDALAQSWSAALKDGEIAFLQPPYGRYIVPFIGKVNAEAALEGCASVETIGLVPGRFDAKWFKAMRPTRICWYGRRIAYIDHTKPSQKDTAKFPSVFPYWGPRPERFEEIFSPHGTVTSWKVDPT